MPCNPVDLPAGAVLSRWALHSTDRADQSLWRLEGREERAKRSGNVELRPLHQQTSKICKKLKKKALVNLFEQNVTSWQFTVVRLRTQDETTMDEEEHSSMQYYVWGRLVSASKSRFGDQLSLKPKENVRQWTTHGCYGFLNSGVDKFWDQFSQSPELFIYTSLAKKGTPTTKGFGKVFCGWYKAIRQVQSSNYDPNNQTS